MCHRPAVTSSLIACVLSTAFVSAAAPSSSKDENQERAAPLRLMPAHADLLLHAPQPRRLLETLTELPTLNSLRQLAPLRELLESTNARRSRQLVAYFEKELGLPWPQLVDRLGGQGAALGVTFGPDPAPVLLVVAGEDEKLMQQFFQLGVQLLDQELARQEAKDKPTKGSYKEYNTVRIGTGFHAALAGASLLVSNSEQALQAGLEQHRTSGKQSMADVAGLREASKLLPTQSLVTLWLNMAKIQQSPGARAAYKAPPRDDPVLTILFGHYLNLLGRTPFVCASVDSTSEGLRTTVVLPRGRDGMAGDKLLHVPPPGVPGSRPLLEPTNVLYSESDYFDLANIWKERTTLFNVKQVQQLEQAEKKATPFLLGSRLSKLLMQAGPYYRFVAAKQTKYGYKTPPKIALPAFALVWELREPEAFAKSMESILRGAALLVGAQGNLQLVEEPYRDCKLIGYRFPEDQPLKGDPDNLRFNFTPCFTRVGDQLVVSSTRDLARELVDLIQKEGTNPARGNASSAHVHVYGSGLAAYLQNIEGLFITQTALDQAVTPPEAREQVKLFLDVIRGLGTLSLEPRFQEKRFTYTIRLRTER